MTNRKQKPRGYWREWSNVEPELKNIIMKNGGRIPTYKEFLELDRSDLAHAIQRHHGGINGIRKKLGIKHPSKRKNDSLKDFRYIKQQIDEIINNHPKLHGEFPSAWWLQQNGYHNIYQGIRNYHGGFRKFRETIGEKQVILENRSWENLEFVLNEIREIMKIHRFNDLPGQWTLKKLGYNSLGYAIQKYHGGFPAFRKVLGQYLGKPSDEERLEGVLEQYVGGSE